MENNDPGKYSISGPERERQSNRAMNLALAANILLALLKSIGGILGHSAALLADGINSTSDVVYNVVVAIFVKRSTKPADEQHPYGHTQLETIGAVVVGAFVVTTAVTIMWNAIDNLIDILNGTVQPQAISPITLVIALFTIVLKIGLSLYTSKAGKQTQNQTIIALAKDHRNDVVSAGAVVVGILLSHLGYAWVDPLAGGLVALVILRTGVTILSDSTDDLMDTVPGKKLKAKMETALEDIPGLIAIDEMKAHRFGQYLVINLSIFVDGTISVNEGDKIADAVEARLTETLDYVRAVHVHFHARPH